jgi:hypothetical protein
MCLSRTGGLILHPIIKEIIMISATIRSLNGLYVYARIKRVQKEIKERLVDLKRRGFEINQETIQELTEYAREEVGLIARYCWVDVIIKD